MVFFQYWDTSPSKYMVVTSMHSVVDAADSRDRRGSAKKRAFDFNSKRFPRNTI